MSSHSAIAAVTTTLRDLLQRGTGVNNVTAFPPDKARTITGPQINLFLYHALPNAAWRNMDVPRQVRPGETSVPPLALNLYYLITAYGDADKDIESHRLLGRAMRTLHDHPVLGRDEIADVTGPPPGDELARQFERIRLTLQPLTLEELTKLWSGFQTHYRLSVAYEASVVLIDSTREPVAPLPVATRGEADRGPVAIAGMFPTVVEVLPQARQPAARLGELLLLTGHGLTAGALNLPGGTRVVRLKTALRETPLDLPPAAAPAAWPFPEVAPAGPAEQTPVRLPDDAAARSGLPAGFYTASVVFDEGLASQRATNESPFALAPRIEGLAPSPAVADAEGLVRLTVTCAPQVWPEQQVLLLIGGRAVPAPRRTAKTAAVTFDIPDAPLGRHLVRLRVDGVDSILVDRSGAVPRFVDAGQTVEIRPAP